MPQKFGNCCKDLDEAMHHPPNSFFRVEDNGVLYLSVGFVQTDKGTGFFDLAVLFCPFCGGQVQSREDIGARPDR